MGQPKKNITAMIFFFCCYLLFPSESLAGEAFITAEAAVLMDARTGRVLFAQNPHEPKPHASTTKITTTILALEKGNLPDQVTISKKAADTGEASIWLAEGEILSLEDLLYAVMLSSANDASVAVAEHIGGSESAFIKMMNEKARALGAKDTNYTNPHGLDHPDHYSSAYDLALITRYALGNPKFQEITKTEERYIPWAGHPWERKLETRNRLLNIFEGVDGVKTGTTDNAGKCFVGSATRDGWQLVSVVLKSGNIWADTPALLEYGFKNFKPVSLVNRNQFLKSIQVQQGLTPIVKLMAEKEIIVPLKDDERERVKIQLRGSQEVKAPVAKGQKLGEVLILLDNQILAKTNLLAEESIKKKFVMKGFWDALLAVLKSFVTIT